VGNASRQLSDGLKPLGMDQLGLEPLPSVMSRTTSTPAMMRRGHL